MSPEEMDLRLQLAEAKIELLDHRLGAAIQCANIAIRELAQVDRCLALSALAMHAGNTPKATAELGEIGGRLQEATSYLNKMMAVVAGKNNG